MNTDRPTPLTHREVSSLLMIATGHDLDSAGRELGLSPWTVKYYLRTASAALGTTNRAHTVAEAFRRGYLGVDLITREITLNPYGLRLRAQLPRQQEREMLADR